MSKIPEGATHFNPAISMYPFRRFYNGCWQVLGRMGVWLDARNGDSKCYRPITEHPDYVAPKEAAPSVADQPAWDGTGLPPVGTVCEYHGAHSDGPNGWEYLESKVLCYTDDKEFVCMQHKNCWPKVERVSNFGFRPIRTPEQIEAEEREKAIGEMVEIMSTHAFGRTLKDYAEALYNTDYRKQEIK